MPRDRRRVRAAVLAVSLISAVGLPASASMRWSTYVGGSGGDSGLAATLVDGTVVVVGSTTSDDFPVSADAHDASRDPGGVVGRDAFVARLSEDGAERIYASYFGGSGEDFASGVVALPANDVLVVVGQTDSLDLPGTAGASFPELAGGVDVFVARFDLATGDLLGTTYLGGGGNDFPRDVLVRPDGSVLVLGETSSADFPASDSDGDGTLGGASDLFVAWFEPGGSFAGARFVGGSGEESGGGIDRAADGSVWVVGSTTSTDLVPGIPLAGGIDVFVARLSADLSTLESAATFGGAGDDRGRDLALAPDGETVVAFGITESDDFPRSADALGTVRRQRDLFVTKLSTASLAVSASTLFGTNGTDSAHRVRTDASGAVVLVASGLQGGVPTAPGGADLVGRPQCNPYCFSDAIVARLNATLSTVQYASYLASSNGDDATAILGSFDVHVTGTSGGADFPTTPGAFAERLNLGTTSAASDAYVSRLDLTASMPRLEIGPGDVSWAPIGGSDAYDVVVGDLETLRAGAGDWALAVDRCLADSTTTTTVGLDENPPPGEGWWIVSRTERSGTRTSYDSIGTGQRGTRDGGLRQAPTSCASAD